MALSARSLREIDEAGGDLPDDPAMESLLAVLQTSILGRRWQTREELRLAIIT